jgi:hypothetical protein
MPDLHVLDSAPIADGVIEKLREALDEAEAGHLSSVAIAVVYRDGATGTSWSSPPSTGTLIGAVTLLQARLARLILDED